MMPSDRDDPLPQPHEQGHSENQALTDVFASQPSEPAGRAQTAAPSACAVVPGYEIISELGRGGMGVVYKARQTKLGRLVALKMILAGAHAGEVELARFRTEAEAIARLQHPNIVQIHEVGEHDGLPFLSLEFCPGGSLDRKLAGTPLVPQEAAAVTERLAQAMGAAHQKGVIHRDLKPANVLLAEDGTLRITDFGLAKKLDEAGRTASGAVLGTPSYMAPEQAGGKRQPVGSAADVYALGAILYECLTGRPPFKGSTMLETLAQVVADEPVPPSRLQPKTPRDLEAICLKCLQKEPGKRYADAATLAEDLRRFQGGQSITARPAGSLERGWRWCRRNPRVASLSAAVVLALVLGSGISAYFAVLAQHRADRLAKETERANERTKEADLQATLAKESALEARLESRRAYARAYVADIRRLQRAREEKQLDFARELLAKTRPENTGGEDYRGFEWHYWNAPAPLLTLKGHSIQVTAMAYSPDGKKLASASQDRSLKVWNTGTGQEIFSARTKDNFVNGFAFSRDGTRLAGVENTVVEMWDADSGRLLHTFRLQGANVHSAAFSPDARRLATGGMTFDGEGELRVWDVERGREQFTAKVSAGDVTSVSFSPEGKWIAGGSMDGITVWDATTGKSVRVLQARGRRSTAVAFSPDGTRLVSSGDETAIKLWDVATGAERLSIEVPPGTIRKPHRVSFRPDGTGVLDVFSDVRAIWDASTGAMVSLARAHGHEVEASSPDGTRLVTSTDGIHPAASVLTVWDATVLEESLPLTTRTGAQIQSFFVTFSPDGKQVATGGEGMRIVKIQGEKAAEEIGKGELRIWDAATGQELRTLKGHKERVSQAQFSPTGKLLVSCSRDHTLKIWDVATAREIRTLRGGGPNFNRVGFSPDETRVVGASWESLQVWDIASGQVCYTIRGSKGSDAAYSPDGEWLAGGIDDMITIWDARTGRQVRTLQRDCGGTGAVRFSPDGKKLVASIGNGQTLVMKSWDAHSGEEVCVFTGHSGMVGSVAFSPNGNRLASSGNADGTVKLWETQGGQEVLSLKPGGPSVYGVDFSSDGRRLAGAGAEGVMIWTIRR
jgi:WD40 repeat protein/tRNA A-37 threonylcarbamoyl transferase component Bud32